MFTPTMEKFIEWYENQSKPVIADKVEAYKKILSKVNGFYDDIDTEKEEIEDDIRDNVLLENEKIKKLDLALESIMK